MKADSQEKLDPADDTGVADVRTVREKIAAPYSGDLPKHAAETDRLVQPLIGPLGLKQGVLPQRTDRRSGTEG